MDIHPIAYAKNDFVDKFGIPRQSFQTSTIETRIVFQPPYNTPDAFREIQHFSHLWIIWQFSEAIRENFTPTVRPPRLGGNKKVGVFATRSPFRPNPIGLSSVKLIEVKEEAGLGTVLYVEGADMLDGTPIYDIKPYIAYSDSHPDAKSSFAEKEFGKKLTAEIPENLSSMLSENEKRELCVLLEEAQPVDDPQLRRHRSAHHREPHLQGSLRPRGITIT